MNNIQRYVADPQSLRKISTDSDEIQRWDEIVVKYDDYEEALVEVKTGIGLADYQEIAQRGVMTERDRIRQAVEALGPDPWHDGSDMRIKTILSIINGES